MGFASLKPQEVRVLASKICGVLADASEFLVAFLRGDFERSLEGSVS